ncbi:MAG TPA: menaquinol oxidoreductase, partial [Nitrospiraceae bacterium]|nr:menaquinol oxidoreductase [Nitrospiraceae bacterium]
MLEKALVGTKKYWTWVFFLFAVIGVGAVAYMQQFNYGLGLTGLSRDVSWGLY